jgi:flagellar protein FlaI
LPPEKKIVSIEDTRELKLSHENWVPAVVRSGHYKYGEITMFDLLKESFRQNPDYLVIGEVRGKEAYIMFHGMASGNNSMGTMHASSPQAVVERLITPPINLSPSVIETLDVIILMVQAKVLDRSARRVQEIQEVQDVINKNLRSNQIFSWVPIDDSFYFAGIRNSIAIEKIQRKTGISLPELQKDFEEKKRILAEMRKRRITGFEEVSKIISRYYKDKEKLILEFMENPFEGQEIHAESNPFESESQPQISSSSSNTNGTSLTPSDSV